MAILSSGKIKDMVKLTLDKDCGNSRFLLTADDIEELCEVFTNYIQTSTNPAITIEQDELITQSVRLLYGGFIISRPVELYISNISEVLSQYVEAVLSDSIILERAKYLADKKFKTIIFSEDRPGMVYPGRNRFHCPKNIVLSNEDIKVISKKLKSLDNYAEAILKAWKKVSLKEMRMVDISYLVKYKGQMYFLYKEPKSKVRTVVIGLDNCEIIQEDTSVYNEVIAKSAFFNSATA